MKILNFLTWIIVQALAAQDLTPEATSGDIDFRSVIHGFKGFMAGFQKGLYDYEYFTLSEACFGTEKVNEQLTFMYEFVNGRESPFKVLQFVTTSRDVFLE